MLAPNLNINPGPNTGGSALPGSSAGTQMSSVFNSGSSETMYDTAQLPNYEEFDSVPYSKIMAATDWSYDPSTAFIDLLNNLNPADLIDKIFGFKDPQSPDEPEPWQGPGSWYQYGDSDLTGG